MCYKAKFVQIHKNMFHGMLTHRLQKWKKKGMLRFFWGGGSDGVKKINGRIATMPATKKNNGHRRQHIKTVSLLYMKS